MAVISCGPSEIETGPQETCEEIRDGIVLVEIYWDEWSLEDLKSDEDLSIIYRDNIEYLVSEIESYREVCENIDGYYDHYRLGTLIGDIDYLEARKNYLDGYWDNNSTSSSSSTTSTIYKEKEACSQYQKEMYDVYAEYQITSFAIEDTMKDWENDEFVSAGIIRSLEIIKNNSLTRFNSNVENLIPDSKNELHFTKWVQMTEGINQVMDLLLKGLENSDRNLLQQGNAMLVATNRDFDLLPASFNCGEE